MNPETTYKDPNLKELFAKTPQSLMEKAPSNEGKQKVIVLAGPTCVGKTKHSLILAKKLGGEIVSADSMQVYRGMDIGTAKADAKEQDGILHHLIDIRNLDERFNVADFYREAQSALRSILARGKVPIVVGGTGFYIHALIYGPPLGPPSVEKVRGEIEKEMEAKGPQTLYDRLAQLDPEYAKTITHADRHKVVRALEIITLTSKKVSDFSKEKSPSSLFDFRCWFLYIEKEVLYSYIEMRCDEMIANGFIEEVKELEKQGLRRNSGASSAIGYKQCLQFLESEATPEDFDQFIAHFKRASRRYAKRQFTWFRKEPLFRWLKVDFNSVDRSIETILTDYELSF